MLDMGFIHDIRKVLKIIPKQRQTLLFSATFSNDIKTLAAEFLQQPAQIQVTPENTATELVSQTVYPVDKKRKRELLAEKIGEENWQQVLIFTRTKHSANKLAEQLGKDGITAAAIHGNKSQGARTRALSDFKAGTIRALVATDIAARGIDIDKLPHVVNFELPNVPEDYIHRIGRTARAGQQGSAISLVCVDELKLLKDIEKLLGKPIEKVHAPGYDVDPSIKAEVIQNGSNRGSGRNQPSGRGRCRAAVAPARQETLPEPAPPAAIGTPADSAGQTTPFWTIASPRAASVAEAARRSCYSSSQLTRYRSRLLSRKFRTEPSLRNLFSFSRSRSTISVISVLGVVSAMIAS